MRYKHRIDCKLIKLLMSRVVFIACCFVLLIQSPSAEDVGTDIIVNGEVQNPGEHTVTNRGLLNAIDKAGGLTLRGHYMIIVSGHKKGKISDSYRSFRIDIRGLLDSSKPDVWIPPGWEVVVPSPFFGSADQYNDPIKKYLIRRQRSFSPEYDMVLMEYYDDINSSATSD